MASSDAKPVPRKNEAYRITFPILDADGDLVTGAATLDSEVSKDGGTFADCTNEATEIATSSGVYFLDLTSTEMNADTVAVIVKTSTAGAKTTTIVLYPEEAGDIRVNVTQVNGTTQTAGDIIGDTNDIQTRLPAALVSGRIDASVGAMATDVVTATALAISAVDEIVDAVWDEVLTAATHNVASSAGRRLRQIASLATVDSNVNDAAATITSFITALTSAVDNFYNDQLIVFTSGALSGQARPILDYDGTTKRITVSEVLTSAPANGDTFTIQAQHIHPVTQIAAGVWDEDATAHQTQGTFGQAIGDPGADTDTIYALANIIAAGVAEIGRA